MATPEEAAAGATLGTPSARKAGRDPRWPYVPVFISPMGSQLQVLGLAYATREEAVAAAESHEAAWRAELAGKLRQPRYRALRAQYGVDD